MHRISGLLNEVENDMILLVIPSMQFFSPQDEASFFNWINTIDGLGSISGSGTELHIKVRSKTLPDRSLRELIALYSRYGLPVHLLAVFETEKNREWFRDPHAYWFRKVFG